ncbi:MAG: histidine kinase [Syntrophus sp. (in: bacteria)]|nr:histidine kinase [Syntrophus sp. (in: bacteria)]
MNTDKSSCSSREGILIAEDSKAQAHILREMLTRGGYPVYAVENGLEGLHKLMEIKPRLIISDVWMPKMNGYQFCHAIKHDKDFQDIPVILLTSMSDTKDIIEGLESGADYYLTKPYDEKILLSMIGSILADDAGNTPGNGTGEKAVVEIKTGGESRMVAVEPQKVVNTLLSTYENLLFQNRSLIQTKLELKTLNTHLEERVKEKTSFLEEEIAQRKKAQEALTESEAKYRGIFENAIEGIFQSTPEGRFINVNPAFLRMLDFSSFEEMDEALSGVNAWLHVNLEDQKKLRDILEQQGVVHGFEAQIYRKNGSQIWIFIDARTVCDEQGRILYYEGTVGDITESKKADEALAESLKDLRKTLDGTVRALATTLEMRDPYTAGHQRRVAQLACALAKEMGFSEEKLEGMEVIGFLHDLGKIVVPAEILSKPGKLNELEYNMIKTHSQVGYDILKGIRFPWPVKKAILQHHERLDGSGYPAGLSGEEIIYEARILAVADVVESMASHRPYRPAMGINSALNEITKNKGILYDPSIVDTCVALFKEKHFKLQQ